MSICLTHTLAGTGGGGRGGERGLRGRLFKSTPHPNREGSICITARGSFEKEGLNKQICIIITRDTMKTTKKGLRFEHIGKKPNLKLGPGVHCG